MKDRKEPDASLLKEKGRLVEGAQLLGVNLSTDCINRLLTYLQLLSKWNRSYNLTAIKDPESMVIYHLLDSLSIAGYLKGNSLLDVGTGAGLPGIPLALLRPEMSVVLLDSNGKKVRFVTQVCIELGLTNVKVVQSRIESYQAEVGGFDNIICRALSDLATFSRSTDKLVSKQGQRLAMKGKIENIERDNKDGWATYPITLPFTEDQRHVQIL